MYTLFNLYWWICEAKFVRGSESSRIGIGGAGEEENHLWNVRHEEFLPRYRVLLGGTPRVSEGDQGVQDQGQREVLRLCELTITVQGEQAKRVIIFNSFCRLY